MALYHKHRPQDFASVIGQEHIVQTIKNQVLTDKVAHAYLFSGPRGVGKTTTARILAKAINCPRENNSPEPDNTSACAIEINNGRSIDVIEIDAASHTGVDNVRENIIDNAQFKPTTLKFKVFIIDEVHMLSTSAFNALLKTLEEPPKHAIFILATTEKHKLPDTIISRCQVFDFKKVPYEKMSEHLKSVAKSEGVKIDKQVLDRIIGKSDGCVRDAISLLDQVMATGEKNITADTVAIVLPTTNVETTHKFINNLINKEINQALGLVQELVSDGTNLPAFAQSTIELLRLMLISNGDKTKLLTIDIDEETKRNLTNLKEKISNLELVKLIDIFITRRAEIKSSPIAQLPLELAVVEWCSDQDTPVKNITETPKITPERPKPETKEPAGPVVEPTVEKVIDEIRKDEAPPLPQTNDEVAPKKTSFTLESVKNIWQECIKKMENISPSLVFILKMTDLVSVDGSTIHSQVQYGFHKDKLTEKNCRDHLEKIISDILGQPAKLEVTVLAKKESETNKQELEDIASAFGGQIV